MYKIDNGGIGIGIGASVITAIILGKFFPGIFCETVLPCIIAFVIAPIMTRSTRQFQATQDTAWLFYFFKARRAVWDEVRTKMWSYKN